MNIQLVCSAKVLCCHQSLNPDPHRACFLRLCSTETHGSKSGQTVTETSQHLKVAVLINMLLPRPDPKPEEVEVLSPSLLLLSRAAVAQWWTSTIMGLVVRCPAHGQDA